MRQRVVDAFNGLGRSYYIGTTHQRKQTVARIRRRRRGQSSDDRRDAWRRGQGAGELLWITLPLLKFTAESDFGKVYSDVVNQLKVNVDHLGNRPPNYHYPEGIHQYRL